MLTNHDDRNESRKPAHLAATILFILVVGLGYSISPQVEGAVNLPDVEAVDDQEPYPSDCIVDGLAFGGCLLD